MVRYGWRMRQYASAVSEGKLTAFWMTPLREKIPDLVGNGDGDVNLRFVRGRAKMRCANDLVELEQRVVVGRWFFDEDIEGRTSDFAALDRLSSAFSSTMPPRAQLMMRTPFFILANAVAPMRPRVSLVSGVWTVIKSALA